ncbi:serine/threonine protein phosphatase, partial [Xanthomonas campestris pv. cannae]|nr:serine/threonine protein phosphatase [Xanthomonas campestris pv. cannae]
RSGRAASVDEALALVRAHAPRIVLGPAQRAAIAAACTAPPAPLQAREVPA